MNLNHLAIFHAVAQAGGFSKGAAQLRISQPAVSKQLRELESSLGLPLVDRSQKSFGLTEAGTLLNDYAQRVFALEAEAERALAELQGLRRGRLAVGASTTIGIYLLPRLFGVYQKLHPNIELDLEIANTDQIQRRLVDRSLQIGMTEGLAENPELDAMVFMEDELVAIVPPRHPLLSQSQVTARELCKQPLIFREQGSGTRVVIERILARKGLYVKPMMSLGSTEAIKRAVASGIGLGIVSRLTIVNEVTAGQLVILPIADVTFRRPLHLLRARGRQPEPSVSAFLDLLGKESLHFKRRKTPGGRPLLND